MITLALKIRVKAAICQNTFSYLLLQNVTSDSEILGDTSAGSKAPGQLLLGHSKIESTVPYLGIEVDDAIEIAEKIDI